MFTLDLNSNAAGTHLITEVEIPPAFLIERFGKPDPGDGHRVTGMFVFRDAEGEVFTVYDYKSTSAYLDDEEAPSPEDFWKTQENVELHIGGKGDNAEQFRDWLLQEQERWKAKKN